MLRHCYDKPTTRGREKLLEEEEESGKKNTYYLFYRSSLQGVGLPLGDRAIGRDDKREGAGDDF